MQREGYRGGNEPDLASTKQGFMTHREEGYPAGWTYPKKGFPPLKVVSSCLIFLCFCDFCDFAALAPLLAFSLFVDLLRQRAVDGVLKWRV